MALTDGRGADVGYGIVITQEGGYHAPTQPRELISFKDPDFISLCKTMSDADIGGFSSSHLTHIEDPKRGGYVKFSGRISIDLPPKNPAVQRSGFAGWRTIDPKATMFGRTIYDLSLHPWLALRVKSDGRQYFVNIQTESIVQTDIHQHKLTTQRPGEWETVMLNLHDFVRTNYGAVVEPQAEIMADQIRTVGISVIDRVVGPFELCIQRVWATREQIEKKSQSAEADIIPKKQFGSLKMKG